MNKVVKTTFLLLILISLAIAALLYCCIWGSNVPADLQKQELFINPGSTYEDLTKQLTDDNYIKSKTSFDLTAGLMKFKKQVKAGLYMIEPGISNRTLISLLRSGQQSPIDLTFNNMRTIHDLAGRISQQVFLDSIDLINYLLDEQNLISWEASEQDLLCHFIPDTYEAFWSDSEKTLTSRLMKGTERFWQSNSRNEKLSQSGLTRNEVYTLASIIQKETIKNDEKPTIAGVYLNRLERGMPLQADPTVVFAVGDFEIKRVLNRHLEIDSPYNTYKYSGLPPGPICMPDHSSIDAVLNPESHRYLYFCSKPDYSGYHLFARSLVEHNNNARRYHRWLNAEKIR